MIMGLKYFHDSLNIVVTLAPCREFFSTNILLLLPIFFNIYGTKLIMGTAVIRFLR